MQEEIEQKTINLCISTTRLTARTLLNVGRAYLRHQQGTGCLLYTSDAADE